MLYPLSYAPAWATNFGDLQRKLKATRLLGVAMRQTHTAVLLLGLLLVTAPAPSSAQTRSDDDRWQITVESGEYIWDIRLVRLTGDSLVYRQADSLHSVGVQQIKEMRLIRKTTMRLGEGEGGGGALSALTGADDEVYDFQTLDYGARLRAIQQILLVHPPKT